MMAAGSLGRRRHYNVRNTHKRAKLRIKLRDTVGVIGRKQNLQLGLLNVDGLSPSSFEDVQTALHRNSLDVCFLLETKRRHEEIGSDITVPGYEL